MESKEVKVEKEEDQEVKVVMSKRQSKKLLKQA